MAMSENEQLMTQRDRGGGVGCAHAQWRWPRCSGLIGGILLLVLSVVAPTAGAVDVTYQSVVVPVALVPGGQVSSAQSVVLPSGAAADYKVAEHSNFAVDLGFRMVAIATETAAVGQLKALTLILRYPVDSRFALESYELLDNVALSTGSRWTDNPHSIQEIEVGGTRNLVLTVSTAAGDPDAQPSILCGSYCLWPSMVRAHFTVGALASSLASSVDLRSLMTAVAHTYGTGSEIQFRDSTAIVSVTRPSALRLSGAPEPLPLLSTATLAVEPLDSGGALLYGDYLISDMAAVSLVPLSGSAIDAALAASTHTLSVVVYSAVDGSQALLTFSDRGLSTTAVLTLDAQATALELEPADDGVVANGETFVVALRPVDARGNVDLDYQFTVAQLMPSLSTTGTLAQPSLVGGNQLHLSATGMPVEQQIRLTVSHQTLAAATTLSVAAVAPGDISAYSITPQQSLAIAGAELGYVVQGIGAGGATTQFVSLASVSIGAGLTAQGAQIELLEAAQGVLTLRYTALDAVEPADVTLALQIGSAQGSYLETVRVVADELRLEVAGAAAATVRAGSTFALTVEGFDRYGNRDVDYSLAASASVQLLQTTATLSQANWPNELSLQGLADHSTTVLRVSDGGISGDIELMVDVVASRLVLSHPAQVANGNAFTLRAAGFDGNFEDADFALSTTAVVEVTGVGFQAAVTAVPGSQPDERLVTIVAEDVPALQNALIIVRDQGLTAGQSTVAIYPVVADSLELDAPLSATATASFALTVLRAFDSATGAEDIFYSLSSTATLSVSPVSPPSPVSLTFGYVGGVGNSLLVTVSQADDNSVAQFTLSDVAANLQGTRSLNIVVEADRLGLYDSQFAPLAGAVLSYGAAFDILIPFAEDAAGNVDLDIFPSDMLSLSTDIGTSTFTVTPMLGIVTAELRGVPDGSTVILTIRDTGITPNLEGVATVTVDVLAERLALTQLSGGVTVGIPFDLQVIAENADGFTDVDYALGAAPALSLSLQLRDGSSSSLSVNRVSDTLLSVTVPALVVGTTALLTVTDSSSSPALSGSLVLTPGSRVTSLSLTVPSLVQVGTEFELAVEGRAVDNAVVPEYQLTSQAVLSATSGVVLSGYTLRSGNRLALRILMAPDNQQVGLTLAHGGASGSAALQVLVAATRFALQVPVAVVPGSTFTVTVRGEDALGNEDVDFILTAAAVASVSRGNDQLSQSLAAGGGGVALRLGGGQLDGALVELTVVDGVLSSTAALSVEVEAAVLAVTAAPAAVVAGESFWLQVSAVDAFGNVDTGYALSSSATVTASAGTVSLLSASASSLTVSLSGVADGAAVTLTVADGALSGAASVAVDVVAAALAVSAPAAVVSGEAFWLQVAGVDAQGAVDAGYALSASATVTCLGGDGVAAVGLGLEPDGVAVRRCGRRDSDADGYGRRAVWRGGSVTVSCAGASGVGAGGVGAGGGGVWRGLRLAGRVRGRRWQCARGPRAVVVGDGDGLGGDGVAAVDIVLEPDGVAVRRC